MFAKFEVRRLDLPAARKILGTAIGMCPKEALFKGYIQLEFEVTFHIVTLTRLRLNNSCFSSVNLIVFEFCMRSIWRYVKPYLCLWS